MRSRSNLWILLYVISSLLFLVTVVAPVVAQKKTPALERAISVKLNGVKLDAALNLIAKQGGFTFSYNSSLIDAGRIININITNKTIREVLNMLFNGKISARAKGDYVILLKSKEEEKRPEARKETFTVTGYVLDENGEKLTWASIYNKKSLASAVTDGYGFYKVELPYNLEELTLNVSKKNFNDTLIQLKDNSNSFLNITLRSITNDSLQLSESDVLPVAVEHVGNSFFMSEEDIANTVNIKDTLFRKIQASFIPFVGSNGRLSGSVINDYSFNLIGGYSMGTKKLEAAGIFNVNRGDVKFWQLAGMANAVGGNAEGCQLAGFVNTVRKNTKGLQGAGFVNVVWGKMDGVQMAGFVNTLLDTSSGVQLAGFVNVSAKSYKGTQAAGFVNATAGNHNGTQIAGFVNVASKDLTGMQISCVNYSRNVKGTQIGFFNYANSCSGVPVGFLSYVNNGYHKVEISADEVFHLNFAFRSGVNSFHNILTVGINPANFNTALWTFGYGIGTTFLSGKQKANGIEFDLTCNQVVMQGNFDKINLINKAYLGMDVKVTRKFSVAFGATINGQLTDADYNLYPQLFNSVKPNVFYSTTYTSSNLDLSMWLGGKVALRFL